MERVVHADFVCFLYRYVFMICRLEEIEATLLFNVEVTHKNIKRHVGIVDPFSTGASLAAYIYSLGYRVIAIYSANMEQLSTMKNLIPQNLVLEFDRIITFDEGVESIATTLQDPKYNLIAVIAGAETGVELADRLSSRLGLRTNGTEFSLARRNKYHMGETVRQAGVRAVKQVKASSWEEVADFLSEWNPEPFAVIAKPIDSAGSEDVTLCRSVEELQDAFGHIMGKVNGLGLVNNAVLVQEYLSGQEYVVDMVSRDGVHKAVALWKCDKRPVNGASFVLFGYIPILASDEFCHELISYQKTVLDALGIMNGPSHGEVKWEQGEPCLVEVGARCHGGEGN
jgi:biotin carboxylase